MEKEQLLDILSHFKTDVKICDIRPLGNGLINDTFAVYSECDGSVPDFVLQRINNGVFRDVDLLQHNIEVVTTHIRNKMLAEGVKDVERHVLRFIPADNNKTYYQDSENNFWRVSVFIKGSVTKEEVNPESAYLCGKTFGNFEDMLIDVPEQLGETIPDFHNMSLRLQQLEEVAKADRVGRAAGMADVLNKLFDYADEMTQADRLFKEGKLPKRICHCDTKVNNMLFDEDGSVLCVIDLDTVMPNFVFSDFGDFLRTGANAVAEDCPDIDSVDFDMDIFNAFSEGYLSSAKFLLPIERQMLPFAATLFPYMQCVRFFADYLDGDRYYKIMYPEHNLVRTKNQLRLFDIAKDKLKNVKI